MEELLASRPDRSRRIQGLQLDTNKIQGFAPPSRHQEIVHAAPRNRYLRDDVEFVPWLMESKQMQGVREYLPPF
jgi:hypothetical protein